MRPITAPEPRCQNLQRHLQAPLQACHGGAGALHVHRAFERGSGEVVDFIDLVRLPPGSSIGRHRHGQNQEHYLILGGAGAMWFEDEWRAVQRGDLLINPPGGAHELRNPGPEALELLVFQCSDGQGPVEEQP